MDPPDSSSYATYARITTSRDAPNPLRPYYVPPSIGLPEPSASSHHHHPDASYSIPSSRGTANAAASSSSSGRDFRELFSDLDYGDYMPEASPGVADMAKRLVDQAIWNYTSVVMAQPFEVAKVVLQCHAAGAGTTGLGGEPEGRRFEGYDAEYMDSDSDESEAPSYFTPTTPIETPSHKPPRRPGPSRTNSTTPTPASTSQAHVTITLVKSDSVVEVISQLWSKESAYGIWKGTNSTFIYGILLKTIETWTTSCLSALLSLPDPTLLNAAVRSGGFGGASILDSPSPFASVGVVVAAAGIAGCLLAPIDMVRTRLILTPASQGPRALLPSLRSLPSLTCPPILLPITLLHSTLPSLLRTSMPLFLRSSLRIDPLHTPGTYSVSSFLLALGELFVKLPLETVLRRCHVSVLSNNDTASSQSQRHRQTILPLHGASLSSPQRFKTIVPVGPYKGIIGTMLYIVHEEGYRSEAGTPPRSLAPSSSRSSSSQSMRRQPQEPRKRRGQGAKGLWRGWRVGFWGLVGMWTAAGIGGGGQGGGEF